MEIPVPADENPRTRNFTLTAQDFIHLKSDQPFFLYLAHTIPHYPVHASDDFRGKLEAGLYGDAVKELVWSVGQVFSTIEQLGLTENTLVMFFKDNVPWKQGNPGYARGRKLLCFKGGFRVPTCRPVDASNDSTVASGSGNCRDHAQVMRSVKAC
jgi:arylsulfatase A